MANCNEFGMVKSLSIGQSNASKRLFLDEGSTTIESITTKKFVANKRVEYVQVDGKGGYYIYGDSIYNNDIVYTYTKVYEI